MPARELDRLIVRMEADTALLRRELRRADGSVEKFAKRSDRNMRRFRLSMDRAAKVTSAFRATLIAVAGTAGLVLLARNAAKSTAQLADTADKLGLNVEALQELRFAAEQVGVSQNTLDLAIQRFTRRLGEARQGTGELRGVIEQYGIALNNADGSARSTIDVLGDLANVTQRAGDAQEQLRIAFKAFDSEGAALVNILRLGEQGFRDLIAEARRLGVVLDRQMVRKAQAANRELEAMERVLSVQLTRAMLAFLPLLRSLANTLGDPKVIEGLRGFAEALADLSEFILKNQRLVAGATAGLIALALSFKIAGARGAKFGAAIAALTTTLGLLSDQIRELESGAPGVSVSLNNLGQSGSAAAQGAKTLAAEHKNLNETLEVEFRQTTQLLGAYQRSAIAVQQLQDDIAVENQLRQAGIDIKTKEGQATARLIQQNLEYKRDLELVQEITQGSITPFDEYTRRVERLSAAQARGSINAQQFAQGMAQARRRLIDTDPVLRGLSDGFDRLGDGIVENMGRGGDALENFRDLALDIAQDVLKSFLRLGAINPLKNSLFGLQGQSAFPSLFSGGGGGGGFLSSIGALFNEQGNVFDKGRIQKFQSGGVVTRPTAFPIAGGTGIAGEAGPEAIMPLARMPGGDLGVKTQTKPSRTHVTISLDGANGNEEIRRIVVEGLREALPGFTETAVQTVIDRRAHDPDLFGAQG